MELIGPAIVGGFNVIVLAYLVRRRLDTPVRRSGAFLAALVTAWSLGGATVVLFPFDAVGYYLSLLSSFLLIPAFFLLAAALTPRAVRPGWWLSVLLIAGGLVLGLLPEADWLRPSGHWSAWLQRSARPGTGRFPQMAGFVSIGMLLAVWRLWEGLRLEADRERAQHLRRVLLALLIPAMMGALANAVMAATGVQWYLSGSLVGMAMADLCLLLLFQIEPGGEDARLVLSSSITVAISAALVLYVAVVVATVLFRLFWIELGEGSFSLVLLVTLVVSMSFGLAKDEIQRGVQFLLAPRRGSYARRLQRMAQELDRTREELRRAERLSLIGEMAAAVAHQIKNPLSPIRGYTQVLSEELARPPGERDEEQMHKALRILREEVGRMDEHLQALLRVECRRPAERRPVRLRDVAERAVLLLQSDRGATGESRWKLSVDGEGPIVMVDLPRLQEALVNLMLNAAEASGDGIPVELRVGTGEGPGGHPVGILEVRDRGVGLVPVDRHRLFEPFYTTKEGGHGLGLGITRRIAEEHGGGVRLEPREGGGTCSMLWVPLAPEGMEVTT